MIFLTWLQLFDLVTLTEEDLHLAEEIKEIVITEVM